MEIILRELVISAKFANVKNVIKYLDNKKKLRQYFYRSFLNILLVI